ncbi:CPBP family intramembrane glutamic endopeptidase [Marinithermus hydrothermalis]|uniref:Abortive infection protein n=1 Tax=Marinithermus hydrothermalis (strain DSM 14884 / JCM 11576 / T1) TaxID=869210 RepID=F2NMK2_MARHT|nr:type II CAAX endopeptidase family protein [Marinithermus hydrothermalis]AEB12172.1 Abortive infection protein [Marinithermus hydrothermalis DSM 14884]
MGSPVRFLFQLQATLLLVGLVWMGLGGYALVARPDPFRDTVAFLALFGALVGLEGVFRRAFPRSLDQAEGMLRQLGRALRRLGFGHTHGLALALLSGTAEEVFFRGGLQNLLLGFLPGGSAILLQAGVFAALHPVSDRRAWAYPVWTFLAGVLFGVTYAVTGSLIPGILAHYLYNAKGFYAMLDSSHPDPH